MTDLYSNPLNPPYPKGETQKGLERSGGVHLRLMKGGDEWWDSRHGTTL